MLGELSSQPIANHPDVGGRKPALLTPVKMGLIQLLFVQISWHCRDKSLSLHKFARYDVRGESR